MPEITVLKADGTEEPFRVDKLEASLARAGATDQEVKDITTAIAGTLFNGITTEAIYREAFDHLRAMEQSTASRYSLRRAMVGLGPTGFPFEDYLAQLFEKQGYETYTRLTLPGKCVPHEIDMLAYKDGVSMIAEAKFHMQPGIKSDVQVVLYSQARFLDLQGTQARPEKPEKINKVMVVTNTKFTSMAIQYAECTGMQLLSWNYPKKGNLQDMIQESRLYPVTVLQSLSLNEKQSLLKQGTVLCKDIIDNRDLLHAAGIPQHKADEVLKEGAQLCTIA